MGTDIHAYIQYKARESSKYLACWEVEMERDYTMFGLMAGIRRDYVLVDDMPLEDPRRGIVECLKRLPQFAPSLEPKGLPSPLSDQIRFEYQVWVEELEEYRDCEDWHTPSWLSLQELEDVQARYANLYTQDVSANMAVLKENPSAGEVSGVFEYFKGLTGLQHLSLLGPSQDLELIIGSMRVMEERLLKPKLVFWFDN